MFDTFISRKNTNSAKWEEAVCETNSEDVIALSVADMDFRSPPELTDSIIKAAEHGIYGYTNTSDYYNEVIKHWMLKQHNWDIRKDWILYCPRVIQAISILIKNNTQEGDGVLIQTPLYNPIRNAIKLNNRVVIENPLSYENNTYQINFENLEKQLSSGVKAMILCSPHNPVGRVWNKEELLKLGKLCRQYNILLISDEVHADFVWDQTFISAGSIQDLQDRVVVCTSPGKTFNIPGLEISNIIIPNEKLREKFKLNLQQLGFHNPSYFAVPVIENAYSKGSNWLREVKSYLTDNYHFVYEFCKENIPEFKIVQSDGTYLMWINYQATHFTEEEVEQWFLNANVAVSLGSAFGEDGIGFIRINIALPKKKLQEALQRIATSKPVCQNI